MSYVVQSLIEVITEVQKTNQSIQSFFNTFLATFRQHLSSQTMCEEEGVLLTVVKNDQKTGRSPKRGTGNGVLGNGERCSQKWGTVFSKVGNESVMFSNDGSDVFFSILLEILVCENHPNSWVNCARQKSATGVSTNFLMFHHWMLQVLPTFCSFTSGMDGRARLFTSASTNL